MQPDGIFAHCNPEILRLIQQHVGLLEWRSVNSQLGVKTPQVSGWFH